MRKLLALGVAALLMIGLLGSPAGAKESSKRSHTAAATATAQLTLVHGVPGASGFPVDISVYRLFTGSQRFEGVTFGTVAGPLDLKPGFYRIAIRPAGAPQSSKPVLSTWTWLGRGDNKSVVAHLTEGGAPRLSVFKNNVSDTGAGNARVTVRHLAQAPAVDVIVNDTTTLVDGLANPREAVAVVPAGSYGIKVAADADNSIVVFSGTLSFASRTNTVVYAVGSLGGGSFTPLVQILPAP